MRLFGTAAAAAAIGAMTFAVSPAEARRYHDRNRSNNNSGAVIVAGIAGVAIGAALAGSGRSRQYGGYYGQPQRYYGNNYYGQPQRYYGNNYYGQPQGYYGQPQGYYGQSYYGQAPSYGYRSAYGNVAYGNRYYSNPHAYHSARQERKHLRKYYKNQRRHQRYGH